MPAGAELLAAGHAPMSAPGSFRSGRSTASYNKSDIADVKNTGGRAAGSITAGWFLREFADGFPWAHLDIAGTAYTERDDPAMGKGPTGMGVRLFSEFLLARV